MNQRTPRNPKLARAVRSCVAIACTGLILAGCSTSIGVGGGGMGGGMGGGVQLPGGGSSGGGSMGGGSMGGGSMGGGSMGGGSMGGGSTGGGSSGGGSMGGGSMGGGASGGGSMGGSDGMGSVQTGANDCNDGGISGGGFGGGLGGCDGSSGGAGGAGGVGQFPGGDQERADELGKELDKSMGDFDEALGEEQREISSTTRNTEGFDTGSGGNRGGSISLGEQAAGAMGGASSGGGGGGGGGDSAGGVGAREGAGSLDPQEVAERTPDDIEAIIDDDIVAKQLREAALSEEDPELRERLWEEYRKYKGM